MVGHSKWGSAMGRKRNSVARKLRKRRIGDLVLKAKNGNYAAWRTLVTRELGLEASTFERLMVYRMTTPDGRPLTDAEKRKLGYNSRGKAPLVGGRGLKSSRRSSSGCAVCGQSVMPGEDTCYMHKAE